MNWALVSFVLLYFAALCGVLGYIYWRDGRNIRRQSQSFWLGVGDE